MISRRTESVVAIFGLVCIALGVAFCNHSEEWFPEFHGSHPLGDNFYAMDWDGGVQLFIYCPPERLHGRTAYSGYEPLYEMLESTNIGCIEFKHNERYVAMKVLDKDNEAVHYYLYDKNCIANLPKDSIDLVALSKGFLELPDESAYNQTCCRLKLE